MGVGWGGGWARGSEGIGGEGPSRGRCAFVCTQRYHAQHHRCAEPPCHHQRCAEPPCYHVSPPPCHHQRCAAPPPCHHVSRQKIARVHRYQQLTCRTPGATSTKHCYQGITGAGWLMPPRPFPPDTRGAGWLRGGAPEGGLLERARGRAFPDSSDNLRVSILIRLDATSWRRHPSKISSTFSQSPSP